MTFAREILKFTQKFRAELTPCGHQVKPGTEGAVSLEGTAAGVVGSAILASYALLIGIVNPLGFWMCIFAALVATTVMISNVPRFVAAQRPAHERKCRVALSSAASAVQQFGRSHCIPLFASPMADSSAPLAAQAESVIGATVQGKYPWLTNEVVNFINTAIGAVVGMGGFLLLR